MVIGRRGPLNSDNEVAVKLYDLSQTIEISFGSVFSYNELKHIIKSKLSVNGFN